MCKIKDRGYYERAKAQMLYWAAGNSYHNNIDDECCPDFSCCVPELYERDEKVRWERFRDEYGD